MEVASLYATLGLKPDTAQWSKGDRLLNGVKKALAALAAYKAFGWAKGLITDVVALGGKLNDLSTTVGVNAEALQELGYAAQQNGSSLDGMGVSLRFLGRNMQTAKQGGGELGKAFRRAGVDFKDARGKLLPVEDVLNNVADAMAKMKTPSERTEFAMRVLGRSGASLVPVLAQGSKELKRLREEARATGGVIDADGIAKLDNLGDSVDRAKFAIQGLKNRAVIALAPAFMAAVDGITAWVRANREMLNSLGTGLLKTFAVVVKGVAIALKAVAAVFDWLGKHPKVAKALLISIGIVLAVIAAKLAVAWVVAKAAVLAVIAALTVLQVVAEPIILILVEAFKTLWHWVREIGAGFIAVIRRVAAWGTAIIAAFARVKGWVVDLATGIVDEFEKAWENVKAGAKKAFEWIIDLPVVKQLIQLGRFIGGAVYDAGHPEAVLTNPVKPKAERTFVEDLINGFGGGMLDNRDALIERIQGASARPRAGGAGAAGPVSVNTNVTINGDADPQAVADKVARANALMLENVIRVAAAEVG